MNPKKELIEHIQNQNWSKDIKCELIKTIVKVDIDRLVFKELLERDHRTKPKSLREIKKKIKEARSLVKSLKKNNLDSTTNKLILKNGEEIGVPNKANISSAIEYCIDNNLL